MLSSCKAEQQEPPRQGRVAEPVDIPVIPKPEPPLDRARLLSAVAEAASAAAAGVALPASVTALDGRQFEFRIRFGCRGPSSNLTKRWLGWSYDADKRTLRVSAKPTISKDEAAGAGIASDAFESVEGFWIPRPWLLEPVCPVAAPAEAAADAKPRTANAAEPSGAGTQAATADVLPEPPLIGIAQFFTSEDARTAQRGNRAYQAVTTVEESEPLPSQGFNLVLSGRLRARPGAALIQCMARDPSRAPRCIISAEFLRVWIEKPATGEVVAQWGSG